MIAYPGNKSRLVLSFDIGTAYSRISYCVLEPGKIPSVQTVSRYPTQEVGCEDSNIPTVIYYDQGSTVCAIGAETTRPGVLEEARRNGWVKAEWLKTTLQPRINKFWENVPSTVDMWWADFLGYLHRCAVQYIESNCDVPSEFLKPPVEFVISYPGEWGADQLGTMREASVKGGLVNDGTAATKYIHFVTEGEATLNFLVQNGFDMGRGDDVVIINAGEVTVTCNMYEKVSNTLFKEVCTTQSSYEGSLYVRQRARDFIRDLLGTSKFHGEIDKIVKIFNENAQLRFGSITECASIRFGDMEDEDIEFNIHSGRLRLRGSDVASFFDPTIRWIIQAIVKARAAAQGPVHSVVLVGGLGRNEYVHSKLREPLQLLGLDFYQPHAPEVTQAVAAGSISYCLNHPKFWRTSRYSYGVIEDGIFYAMLPKGETVVEAKEYMKSYCHEGYYSPLSNSYNATHYIGYSRGGDDNKVVCLIADHVPGVKGVGRPKGRKKGGAVNNEKVYNYIFDYSIVLKFSRTEFNARVAWNDPHSGHEKCGPAINIPYVY